MFKQKSGNYQSGWWLVGDHKVYWKDVQYPHHAQPVINEINIHKSSIFTNIYVTKYLIFFPKHESVSHTVLVHILRSPLGPVISGPHFKTTVK